MKRLYKLALIFTIAAMVCAAQTINYTPVRYTVAISSDGGVTYSPLTSASGIGQVTYTPPYFVPMCSNDGGVTYSQCSFSGGGGGSVDSVANSDGTLHISPNTGAVVASLALGHANTWTAAQTFSGVILSGVSAGTSPVCPNGAGGALTTTGCSGGGGAVPATCPTQFSVVNYPGGSGPYTPACTSQLLVNDTDGAVEIPNYDMTLGTGVPAADWVGTLRAATIATLSNQSQTLRFLDGTGSASNEEIGLNNVDSPNGWDSFAAERFAGNTTGAFYIELPTRIFSNQNLCWLNGTTEGSSTCDTMLSRSSANNLSLDTTTAGNHFGNLTLNGLTETYNSLMPSVGSSTTVVSAANSSGQDVVSEAGGSFVRRCNSANATTCVPAATSTSYGLVELGLPGMVNITSLLTWTGCTLTGTPATQCIVGTATGSVSYSNIPGTYSQLVMMGSISNTGTGATSAAIQFNLDGSGDYVGQQIYATGTANNTAGTGLTSIPGFSGLPGTVGGGGGAQSANFTMTCQNYSGTTFYKQCYASTGRWLTSTTNYIQNYEIEWQQTSAITSAAMFSQNIGSGDNIAVGSTFSVYGIP